MEMYSRDDLEHMREDDGDVDVPEDDDLLREPETWYDAFWQRLGKGLSWFTSLFYNPSSANIDDEL